MEKNELVYSTNESIMKKIEFEKAENNKKIEIEGKEIVGDTVFAGDGIAGFLADEADEGGYRKLFIWDNDLELNWLEICEVLDEPGAEQMMAEWADKYPPEERYYRPE
jgi:hypothetical protein